MVLLCPSVPRLPTPGRDLARTCWDGEPPLFTLVHTPAYALELVKPFRCVLRGNVSDDEFFCGQLGNIGEPNVLDVEDLVYALSLKASSLPFRAMKFQDTVDGLNLVAKRLSRYYDVVHSLVQCCEDGSHIKVQLPVQDKDGFHRILPVFEKDWRIIHSSKWEGRL
ncbi:hypothetical protein BDN72DRAFT_865532, partial [Pluteus cervinus]